ncbi:MAG: hypothetical protein ACRDQ4_18030 [Pseudonocardiaceae bacterium]
MSRRGTSGRALQNLEPGVIERGEIALDRRSDIVALANALEIAPSELTRLPELTTGNGEGPVVKAVRRALIAVTRDDPAGHVVPVDVLRTRVATLVAAQRYCDHEQVGSELPALIRDLHTTMAAGRDVGELLEMAVVVHVQGTHTGRPPTGLTTAGRWPGCGGRQDDAVKALRTAELISPPRVQRHPFVGLTEGHVYRCYLALCGELLPTSKLPPATCPDDCAFDVLYCSECVRGAAQWTAEAQLAERTSAALR